MSRCSGRGLGVSVSIVLAAGAGVCACSAVSAQTVANFARHQFATGSAAEGDLSALYAADGKVGPENRHQTRSGGRHRVNLFFDEPVEVGSLHLYSMGYGGQVVQDFDVFYMNEMGAFVPAPGGGVTGNTSTAVEVMLSSPVVTERLRILFGDDVVEVDEVAVFPPNGGAGYPIGTDVNLHQGRQHRVARTVASSTAAGTTRRSVVDGFVNDADYWASSGSGPHTIELDLRDPPETTPVSVRTTTTPVLVGGAHVYTGLSDGTSIATVGKFQSFDDVSGLWVDIAGSNFANNTSTAFEVLFDAPVETARIRLVVGDFGTVVVREIVPLPPRDGLGWPMGTSVTFAERPDYRTLSDEFFALEAGTTGLVLTSDGSGGAGVAADVGVLSQQYQVLLNVGTDTYRIRNRVSGWCLAVAGASRSDGAAVVEAEYAAQPHQRWRKVDAGGGLVRFENAFSGLALGALGSGLGLEQRAVNALDDLQRWGVAPRALWPKKGQGGFPSLAGTFGSSWAYNWGKSGIDYPASVDYWPMQWGSFFWTEWPELNAEWQRNPEPQLLMGYNEPDAASQSNIPVQTGIDMWPRLEAQGLPLLAPAPVNPTNAWITAFMDAAVAEEYRVEYAAVHWYGGDSPDALMNALTNTYNAFGLDLVLSEFSVVDWQDTNGWDKDDVYRFFLEALWRLEELSFVKRYAIFVFTEEPGNAISDNRGGMRFADGTLTPAGRLYGAWDGDTTIRTDTRYHLHNKGRHQRIGANAGGSGSSTLGLGDRFDEGDAYRWVLEPAGAPGAVRIRSELDGRVLAANGAVLELMDEQSAGAQAHFAFTEAEHGWFYLDSVAEGTRVRMDPGLQMDAATFTGANVQWRFVPVFEAAPAAPREVVAAAGAGLGEVEVSWAEHGFRDLESFAVYRWDTVMSAYVLRSDGVTGTSFVDSVPAPGSYMYAVSAIGDTGESGLASASAVSVGTCPPDFNGDFMVDELDVLDAIDAIGMGLDYNADSASDSCGCSMGSV